VSQYLAHLHNIEHNQSIPSWRCEATRRADFKRVTFWMRGSQIVSEEQARVLAANSFPHLDCSEKVFKCERREGEGPPPNRKPVPLDWIQYGTDRMKAEIDAGLRPHSDYLLPPLELPRRPKVITLRR
jgi:hypothetical protein